MCDYSLHTVASRPARTGDKLVTSKFFGAISQGFVARGEPDVAICVLPGTELVFDKDVKRRSFLFAKNIGMKIAIFRQINIDIPAMHHDALEFADGTIILLDRLCLGQHATVLQLPVPEHSDLPIRHSQPSPVI